MENTVITPITKKCKTCGNEFVISPAEQKFYTSKNYEFPKRCPDCVKNKQISEEKVCVDCGATFTITNSEKEFFEENKLFVPLRCPSCREFKKKRNEQVKGS